MLSIHPHCCELNCEIELFGDFRNFKSCWPKKLTENVKLELYAIAVTLLHIAC